MKIKYKQINQINIYEKVKYEVYKNNILKVLETNLRNNEETAYYYDLNSLDKEKKYMSSGYIINTEFEDENIILTLLNPSLDEEAFVEEGKLNEFQKINEEIDINSSKILTLEELIFPEVEKPKEEILQEEIEILKNRIVQENKKNERAQLEMLELIMSMM